MQPLPKYKQEGSYSMYKNDFNMLPRPTISHANYPKLYIAYHVQNALSNTLVSHREHYITGYKNTNTMFLIPLLSRHHSVNILLQKIME